MSIGWRTEDFVCFPLARVILQTVCVGGQATSSNEMMLHRTVNLADKLRVSNRVVGVLEGTLRLH